MEVGLLCCIFSSESGRGSSPLDKLEEVVLFKTVGLGGLGRLRSGKDICWCAFIEITSVFSAIFSLCKRSAQSKCFYSLQGRLDLQLSFIIILKYLSNSLQANLYGRSVYSNYSNHNYVQTALSAIRPDTSSVVLP